MERLKIARLIERQFIYLFPMNPLTCFYFVFFSNVGKYQRENEPIAHEIFVSVSLVFIATIMIITITIINQRLI